MSANQFPPLLASAGRSDATQSGLDDVDIPRFYDMLHGLLNLRCAVWCWRGFYNTLGELSHGADSGATVIFVVLRGWIMQLSGSNSIGLEEALMSTSCHVTDSTPFESKLAIDRNCCVALSQQTRFCSLLQLRGTEASCKADTTFNWQARRKKIQAAVMFVVLRGWIMQLSGSNSIGLEEALMSTSCHVTDSTPFESKLAIDRNCCVALSQQTRFCSLLQLRGTEASCKADTTFNWQARRKKIQAAVMFVVLRGWIMQLSGSNSIGLEEALMSTSCHVTDSTPFESKLAIGRNCCVALSQQTRFCSLLQLEAQRLRLKLTQLATGKLAAKNFRPLRSRGEGIRTFHGLRLATCPHPILRRSRCVDFHTLGYSGCARKVQRVAAVLSELPVKLSVDPSKGPKYLTRAAYRKTYTLGIQIKKIQDVSAELRSGYVEQAFMRVTGLVGEAWRFDVWSDVDAKSSLGLRAVRCKRDLGLRTRATEQA